MNTQDKAKWLSEMFLAVAEGMNLKFIGEEVTKYPYPTMNSMIEDWIIEPAKTPVDLSVLVNSGVDCEFWDGNEDIKFFGMLNNIISDEKYRYIDREESWPYCQPRMNHWMSPLNDQKGRMWDLLREAGFAVETRDYYAYRITGVQEGRCMPWEEEK